MLGFRPDFSKVMALSGELSMVTFWKESCQEQRKAKRGAGGGLLRATL